MNRGDRRLRRAAGKSDTIDAEAAARSVLAGQSTAIPKTADGAVEIMRQLKVALDTAVKARTTAMITLKQIIVTASPGLRDTLQGLTAHARRTRCAGLRPGPLDTPAAAAKHTRRALARRWITLDEEIATHDRHLVRLTTETAPTLREGFGVGAGTAAEMLILFGDTPTGFAPKPRSRSCVAPVRSRPRPGEPPAGIGSIGAVTDTPTPPSIEPCSSACGSTSRPSNTWLAARRTARPSVRSFDASNASLAREIYQRVMTDFRTRPHVTQAA